MFKIEVWDVREFYLRKTGIHAQEDSFKPIYLSIELQALGR